MECDLEIVFKYCSAALSPPWVVFVFLKAAACCRKCRALSVPVITFSNSSYLQRIDHVLNDVYNGKSWLLKGHSDSSAHEVQCLCHKEIYLWHRLYLWKVLYNVFSCLGENRTDEVIRVELKGGFYEMLSFHSLSYQDIICFNPPFRCLIATVLHLFLCAVFRRSRLFVGYKVQSRGLEYTINPQVREDLTKKKKDSML